LSCPVSGNTPEILHPFKPNRTKIILSFRPVGKVVFLNLWSGKLDIAKKKEIAFLFEETCSKLI